ncbi:MAG: hypothetical protein LBT33_01310, partial [Spirochaetia bacterium]|nr:hypothetical protein [Spirochaetia bacterium]
QFGILAHLRRGAPQTGLSAAIPQPLRGLRDFRCTPGCMGEQRFAKQIATSRDAWRAAILRSKIATSPLRPTGFSSVGKSSSNRNCLLLSASAVCGK